MSNQGHKAENIHHPTSSHVAEGVTKSRGKFTPGPWKIDRELPPNDFSVIGRVWDEGYPDTGSGIAITCSIPGPHDLREGDANAHLIAAAPDLLGDAIWAASEAESMRDALNKIAGNDETLCDIVAGLDEIAAQHRSTILNVGVTA